MSKTMNINGHEFKIIGQVESGQLGKSIPMLDIPMMSDERWQELCVESARKHFVEEFGREPASDKEALDWNRRKCNELISKNIALDDIVIMDVFKETPPSETKLLEAQQYYTKHGKLKSEIILSDNKVLLDGYTSYIVAKNEGLKEVPFTEGVLEVIVGTHKGSNKRYEWKVPQELQRTIKVGDMVKVHTQRGIRTITVVYSKCLLAVAPDMKLNSVHRKVIKHQEQLKNALYPPAR